jgi:flagellar basal-body rod modification protein FlgD
MISGTTGTSAGTAATAADTAAKTSKTMGQDAFLRLLTTQLAHQDPMKPQADTEFIAQLAQFSSLEQLTQIQTTLTTIGTALGVPVATPGTGTTT